MGPSHLSLNVSCFRLSPLTSSDLCSLSRGSYPIPWLWWPSQVWWGSSPNFVSLQDSIDKTSLHSALHIYWSNCLLNFSVWMSNWRFKCKISKIHFLISSQTRSSPSLPQLSKGNLILPVALITVLGVDFTPPFFLNPVSTLLANPICFTFKWHFVWPFFLSLPRQP